MAYLYSIMELPNFQRELPSRTWPDSALLSFSKEAASCAYGLCPGAPCGIWEPVKMMPSKRIGVHCAYFLQLILFLPVVETRQVSCKAPKSHFDTTGTLLNLNPFFRVLANVFL